MNEREECTPHHKLLVCDMMSNEECVCNKKSMKIESNPKNYFREEFTVGVKNDYGRDSNVQEQWEVLRKGLFEAVNKLCGWTQGPARHKTSWWWNDGVDASIQEKRRAV